MKIRETVDAESVERQCCHMKDLKPVEYAKRIAGQVLVFCVHCGHRHYVPTPTGKPDALRDIRDHSA